MKFGVGRNVENRFDEGERNPTVRLALHFHPAGSCGLPLIQEVCLVRGQGGDVALFGDRRRNSAHSTHSLKDSPRVEYRIIAIAIRCKISICL